MKPMMTARTCRFAASARPRIDYRRRLSLAGLAVACVLLAGCSLLGGGGTRERGTIYAPDPRIDADPSWPTVPWQLAIAPATAARMTDSLRIAVRPTPGEIQVYKGANWSKPPTQMLEDAVLRALEDSGRIGAVARQGSGINGDSKLVIDMRRFGADYAVPAVPSSSMSVTDKLLPSAHLRWATSRDIQALCHAASMPVVPRSSHLEPTQPHVTRQ